MGWAGRWDGNTSSACRIFSGETFWKVASQKVEKWGQGDNLKAD